MTIRFKLILLALLFIVDIHGIYAADLSDVALLYDSSRLQNSDINFKKIAEYYGLRCREIDLRSASLSDSLLRDENGVYLKALGINASTLESGLLDSTELKVLGDAINFGGIYLLISEISDDASQADHSTIKTLTNGEVLGAFKPVDSEKDWIISPAHPEITREFTGQTLQYQTPEFTSEPQIDYALLIDETASHIDTIISATDDQLRKYPIFIRYQTGVGSIFLDGSPQIYNFDSMQMWKLYNLPVTYPWPSSYDERAKYPANNTQYFSQIVPTMTFVRYAGGDECWHSEHDYANLTIDDPSLIPTYGGLTYAELLPEMESHNFHTTIAFIPRNYLMSQDTVVNIFLNHPDRYSLVQHGNNHKPCPEFFGPSMVEQEADIVEGLTRMEEHKRLTGVPYGKVMIFPCTAMDIRTLKLLKKYNFNITINHRSTPRGAVFPTDYDYDMYQAIMNYNDFPSLERYVPEMAPYLFDLFIDKPVLLFDHSGYFSNDPGAFNATADAINSLSSEVEWKSLDYIAKHLYLQKTNDDGSIDVKFYGNNVIISNETDQVHLYHLKKEEWLNVPIHSITVDGAPVEYTVVDSLLQIDLTISPHSSREILITYSSGDKDFAISDSDIYYDPSVSDTLYATVHNYGNDGGPVCVQFFDADPDSGGNSLALTTIERIGPDSSAAVGIVPPVPSYGTVTIYVKVDPHNVILESNEENNQATFTIELPTLTVIDDFEYEDSPLNHGWSTNGLGEISTVYDSALASRVLQATTAEGTQFRIYHSAEDNPREYLSVRIKDTDFFIFYVYIHADDGQDYFLEYTPDEGETGTSGNYVFYHLGTEYSNGSWHTISRNLAEDLYGGNGKHFEYVKGFYIRGDYRLDDLILDIKPTAVEVTDHSSVELPTTFNLSQNYPNPFNTSTVFSYQLPVKSKVQLEVYNILGQKVATLVNEVQAPGYKTVRWDATADDGSKLASGVYLYHLKAGSFKKTRKLLLLR